MLDAKLRPLIDPALNRIGRALAGAGVTANALTFTGHAPSAAEVKSFRDRHIKAGHLQASRMSKSSS